MGTTPAGKLADQPFPRRVGMFGGRRAIDVSCGQQATAVVDDTVRRPLRPFGRPFWLRFTYVTSVSCQEILRRHGRGQGALFMCGTIPCELPEPAEELGGRRRPGQPAAARPAGWGWGERLTLTAVGESTGLEPLR
jgi:hypothetical protein